MTFDLPGMRLVNPTNEHTHWRSRQRRAQDQRGTAKVVTLARCRLHLPAVVTITRVGPGKLDDDSLPASAKHVRDGIADAFGVRGLVKLNAHGHGDDGDPRIEWRYTQEKSKTFGVRVEICAVERGAA